MDVLLRLPLCWMNTPNYQQNGGLLGSCSDVYSMLLKCRDKGSWVFFASVTWLRNNNVFLFWKFHWVWRDVGGTPWVIKKMMDFWKIVLDSSECQKYTQKSFRVSLALVARLRNYNFFYFGSFTEFDVMSKELLQLSRKWRISGKWF